MKTNVERDIVTRVTIEGTPREFMEMLRWVYAADFAESRMGDGTLKLKPEERPNHVNHPYRRLLEALSQGSKEIPFR